MSTSRDELNDKLAAARKSLDLANKLNTEDKDSKHKSSSLPSITAAKKLLDDAEILITAFQEGDKKEHITQLISTARVQLKSTGYNVEPKPPRVVKESSAPTKASNSDTPAAELQTSWCLSTILCGLFAPAQEKPATNDENTTLTGEKNKPGSPGLNLRDDD